MWGRSRRLVLKGVVLVVIVVLGVGALAGLAVFQESGSHALEAPTSVDHVFLILLENKDYDVTFGTNTPAPFLGRTLVGEGRLLTQYHGIGHRSLVNYIALVSGQPPNAATRENCEGFVDFRNATVADGIMHGDGCVYPTSIPTIGEQLEAAGKSWRMYGEDMANAEPSRCRHPTVGQADPWQKGNAHDQYATKHIPFVYFHTVIDDAARCRDHVVDLDHLKDDLKSSQTTPNYAFISPDLCSDGHDEPCFDGRPGGYASIEAFLSEWIPRIRDSPAYREGGLIVVTFDESEEVADPPGGRIGAILLSPCIPGGTRDEARYDHYGLLGTVEDVFGLRRLGLASGTDVRPLDLGPCNPNTPGQPI